MNPIGRSAMFLFELGTRPWEVKEDTPEKTAEKRRRIELYEAFCYNAVANQKFQEAQQPKK
jgi:hypothetical protein